MAADARPTARSISVVIPAFNEERCISTMLERLRDAETFLTAHSAAVLQVLVVDSASTAPGIPAAAPEGLVARLV